MDEAVYRLLLDELARVGTSSAEVNRVWSGAAGMWFVEVTPEKPDAARLTVAAQDSDTLNVTVGDIWFEVFGKAEKSLPHLRQLVAAVFRGDVEQSGSPDKAYGRIHTDEGPVNVGALPGVRRRGRRPVHRYAPYSAN